MRVTHSPRAAPNVLSWPLVKVGRPFCSHSGSFATLDTSTMSRFSADSSTFGSAMVLMAAAAAEDMGFGMSGGILDVDGSHPGGIRRE